MGKFKLILVCSILFGLLKPPILTAWRSKGLCLIMPIVRHRPAHHLALLFLPGNSRTAYNKVQIFGAF